MAGFPVSINGRFWVSTEVTTFVQPEPQDAALPSKWDERYRDYCAVGIQRALSVAQALCAQGRDRFDRRVSDRARLGGGSQDPFHRRGQPEVLWCPLRSPRTWDTPMWISRHGPSLRVADRTCGLPRTTASRTSLRATGRGAPRRRVRRCGSVRSCPQRRSAAARPARQPRLEGRSRRPCTTCRTCTPGLATR